MKRLTTKEFVSRAKVIHGGKYNYSKSIYISAKTKMIIICPKHGEFEQISYDHLSGHGCRKCAGNFPSNNEAFINKSNNIHGHIYDYSKVKYINAYTKIIIVCPKHGEFKQTPNNHLGGKGCPKCNNNNIPLNNDIFVARSRRVHDNKYDYSKVNYIKNDTKVIILCPKHGEFRQRPSDHMNGRGCSKCGFETTTAKITKNIEIFVRDAVKKHGKKYDYSKAKYINAKIKIVIICPEHGKFMQTPNSHLSGYGCPKCGGAPVSASSQTWLESINILKENREKRIYIEKKYIIVDAYDPKTNTIYEFYGDFWHGNPQKYNSEDINCINNKTFGQLYKETKSREKMIKDAGYNLISIWESDWLK